MKSVLSFLNKHLTAIFVVVILLVVGLLAVFASPNDDGTRTFDGQGPTYTEAQRQAACEVKNQIDTEVQALSGIDVPQDSTSDCAPTDLPQMGSLTYYKVAMATPAEFVNSVNGRGFNEGYGLQCVAAFKQFMFSLSGKYFAASGGGAKGYATQQAQIEPLGFKWYSGAAGLQDGDWGIWTNGQYGHVAMYYQGKWFGQNQYAANPNTGNAFNLASISTNGLAGYYRPNIYVKSNPVLNPTPQPATGGNTGSTSNTGSSTGIAVSNTYTVRRGDTLGNIILKAGWYSGTNGLYGDNGYAQKVADFNGISPRGLIYPNTVIKRP